jgi:hypothetical protein
MVENVLIFVIHSFLAEKKNRERLNTTFLGKSASNSLEGVGRLIATKQMVLLPDSLCSQLRRVREA